MRTGSTAANNGGGRSDRHGTDAAQQQKPTSSTAKTPTKATSPTAASSSAVKTPSGPRYGRRAAGTGPSGNLPGPSPPPSSSPGSSAVPPFSSAHAKSDHPSDKARDERALHGGGDLSGTDQTGLESGVAPTPPVPSTMAWFTSASTAPPARLADTELGTVKSIADGTNEKARLVEMQRTKAARERFAQQVADAPQGYQMSMPRLTDIDGGNRWNRLLQTIHSEFDMSCLTACLVNELDTDETWNPEMLLVQLTSDMRDVTDRQGGEAESTEMAASHSPQSVATAGAALAGGRRMAWRHCASVGSAR